MRRQTLLLLVIASLPGCFGSCPTAADARAKARIFSPQQPPRAERDAKQHLAVGKLGTDAKVRHRILRMPAAEMRWRLGSFVAVTKTHFEWTHEKDEVHLAETATLDQARSGDFRIAVDNDHDFGMELRWVDHVAYVKNLHGKFLQRRSDEAAYLKWRQEALAQLPVWFALVRDRVALARVGTGTEDGRPVIRYAVALAKKADPAVAPPPKPPWARPPVYPKGGPDVTLEHRLAVWQRGKPTMASGEIWVDTATGVVTHFDLHAEVTVPPGPDAAGPPATLHFETERDVSGIGAPHPIAVPEHRPLEDRPKAVMHEMDWWPPYAAHEKKLAAEHADGGTPGDGSTPGGG